MKMHLDHGTASYRIRAYEPGHVVVDDTRYDHPLIVMPEQLIPDWPVAGVASLSVDDFSAVFPHEPEILLLGTGTTQVFPDSALVAAMAGRGIGLEVMDTPAACRTYNILMSEDRRVAAALLMMS